jgi:SAM-dependent methyltransferase
MTDVLDGFKAAQRAGWAHFAPLAVQTTGPAAQLVHYAGIQAGQQVLDVACGTGVVAVTAARLGARVTGLDLTPQLLEAARDNARTADVAVDFHEGDAEALPFDDGAFDVVVSQYGHIFAPRPDVVTGELLRVLRPGGVIAFSTWPPELFVGRMFALTARYMPPPPPGVSPPAQWGDPALVRERLGDHVRDLRFDRRDMLVPTLSPRHAREVFEKTAGPVIKLVEMLSSADPAKLGVFRTEMEALIGEYFADNVIRQGYLLTRAVKL